MNAPRKSPSGPFADLTTDDIRNLSSAEGEPLTVALNNLVAAQRMAQEVVPFGVCNGTTTFGSVDGVFRTLGFVTTSAILQANVVAFNLDVLDAGDVHVGLYNESFQLVSEGLSGFAPCDLGLNVRFIPPIDLVPLAVYSVGITSRLGAAAEFTSYNGGLSGKPTPRRFIEETTGNAGTAMRASFDATLPGQTDRPWAIIAHL